MVYSCHKPYMQHRSAASPHLASRLPWRICVKPLRTLPKHSGCSTGLLTQLIPCVCFVSYRWPQMLFIPPAVGFFTHCCCPSSLQVYFWLRATWDKSCVFIRLNSCLTVLRNSLEKAAGDKWLCWNVWLKKKKKQLALRNKKKVFDHILLLTRIIIATSYCKSSHKKLFCWASILNFLKNNNNNKRLESVHLQAARIYYKMNRWLHIWHLLPLS